MEGKKLSSQVASKDEPAPLPIASQAPLQNAKEAAQPEAKTSPTKEADAKMTASEPAASIVELQKSSKAAKTQSLPQQQAKQQTKTPSQHAAEPNNKAELLPAENTQAEGRQKADEASVKNSATEETKDTEGKPPASSKEAPASLATHPSQTPVQQKEGEMQLSAVQNDKQEANSRDTQPVPMEKPSNATEPTIAASQIAQHPSAVAAKSQALPDSTSQGAKEPSKAEGKLKEDKAEEGEAPAASKPLLSAALDQVAHDSSSKNVACHPV